MLNQLTAVGITALHAVILPLLVLIVAWAGIQARAWIQEKVKHERFKNTLIRFESTLEDAIKEVQQTFVLALVEATPAAMEEAKKKALDTVRAHLGAFGLTELRSVLGLETPDAVEKFMVTTLEAKVHDFKLHNQLRNKALTLPGEDE